MKMALKCKVCSEEFNSLDELNGHSELQHKEHRTSKNTKFKCNMCVYKCGFAQDLMRHMRTHTGERPFKCKVSSCEMMFKLESHLKAHKSMKHSDESPFKCDLSACRFATKTASDLIKHMKVHSEERPFACPHSGCNFRAKRNYELSKHTAGVHSESKAMTCSRCKYSTNIASNLSRHMAVHEGKNVNIPCSIKGCEFQGINSRALKDHLRRHKSILVCPVSGCGRCAPTKEALKDHMKLHNPSGRAFQCPLCFKHSRTLEHLQSHCVVHTNEKPLQCGHCEYAAATKAVVKRHISALHAKIPFPFIVHLLDDRECLRCKVILPSAEFVVHCQDHM